MNALIIDDSLAMRRILGKIMAGLGFETIEAKDGAEGLAMFLEKYSAKGVEYTSLVESMIEQHGLEIADTARLADGPEIVIKPIDGR